MLPVQEIESEFLAAQPGARLVYVPTMKDAPAFKQRTGAEAHIVSSPRFDPASNVIDKYYCQSGPPRRRTLLQLSTRVVLARFG
jgi:hypothetical protein